MDISNPFNVRWLGSVDSRGEIDHLILDGDIVYAHDSLEGVVMFDIRHALPRKLTSLLINYRSLN